MWSERGPGVFAAKTRKVTGKSEERTIQLLQSIWIQFEARVNRRVMLHDGPLSPEVRGLVSDKASPALPPFFVNLPEGAAIDEWQ